MAVADAGIVDKGTEICASSKSWGTMMDGAGQVRVL